MVNLEPRRMRGVVSEGMLLDIGHADGIAPALAVPGAPSTCPKSDYSRRLCGDWLSQR
ncbi:hypothetical protein SBA4_2010006 [Candidatus Sulfopaludibacter sp. SbA4]|nr:hypothetical protein SBA4_2010006 [Candidatus Sulfopaludibacter sp. SbA4]